MSKNVKKWILGIVILAVIAFSVNMCMNKTGDDAVIVNDNETEMIDETASDAVEESVVKEVETEEVEAEETTDEKPAENVEEDSTDVADKN